MPYQPIGEHLIALVVYDLPEATAVVNQNTLDQWDVSFYEALEVARENLEQTPCSFAKVGDFMYGSATGDSYDASRLLMLDLIRRMEVKGCPIALVPNRETLLVTGSDDVEGLEAVAKIAEKALDDPRPINAIPLRLDGTEWVEWMPPADHPLYAKFRLLELQSLGREYADQKPALEALYEKQGIDRFVATYLGRAKQGNRAGHQLLRVGQRR
jgi:hypothetical protein